jgi:hypothetical protein
VTFEDPPIVLLASESNARDWSVALIRAGYPTKASDPFTFVPPSSFAPFPIRLAVVDSALDVAPTLLQAIRAANVPTILASGGLVSVGGPPRDPLTHYGAWIADAYVGSPTELVRAVPIVLDPQTKLDGKALHLTYRGSMPPQDVPFPIGTAFPLRPGASVYLGRSRTLNVQLSSPHVGRVHALVAAIPGPDRRAAAVDLKSGNGTYVKGKRVAVEVIAPGDEIAIAGYRFVLEALGNYAA